MRKIFFSPYITFYIFSLQFFIWLIFMPNELNLELKKYGMSYKYINELSFTRFVIIYFIFLFFIFIGTKIKLQFKKINFNKLNNYNNFLSFFWIIAEILSIKVVILNLKEVIRLYLDGKRGVVSELIRSNILFTETFINLGPLILSISLFFYFNNYKKKRNLIKILLIFCGTLINGLLLFKRMHFVYSLFIWLYFLLNNKKGKGIMKYILFLFLFIFISEMLRFGSLYAYREGKELVSIEVIKMVFQYLMIAYLASDFNNAMVILSNDSSYQLLSTASPFFQKLLFKLNGSVVSYATVKNWESSYGTVNSMALWWYDFGVYTVIICLIIGLTIGIVYGNFKRKSNKATSIQIIAPIFVLGNIVMFRVNIFFTVVILMPLFFWFIYIILVYILTKE